MRYDALHPRRTHVKVDKAGLLAPGSAARRAFQALLERAESRGDASRVPSHSGGGRAACAFHAGGEEALGLLAGNVTAAGAPLNTGLAAAEAPAAAAVEAKKLP